MTKKFSINLTDEEYEALKKQSEESDKTMRDILFESIEKGTLKDGVRIEEHQPSLVQKRGKTLTAHVDVLEAVRKAHSIFGGYDYEKALASLSVLGYSWENLNDEDKALLLAPLKHRNMEREPDPKELLGQFKMIARDLDADENEVKENYRRARYKEIDGGFEATLEED